MITVVTGATGHVGANLVRALLAKGRKVRAVVHQHSHSLTGLPVELVSGDVTQPETLRAAFAGADVVYHLASLISIRGDMGGRVPAVNVRGAGNVAEAALAAGVRRLVHFSSIHAFRQDPLHEPLDERRSKVDGGRHPAYDISKAAGEGEIRRVIERGLDAVIVNPTAIIGPHDYQPSRVGRVLLGVLTGRLPALIDGGFDWVDVRDVAEGAMAAEERGQTGENYLLGGTWRSVRDLAHMMGTVASVRPPRMVVPMWLARAGAPFADTYGRITDREPLYTSESLTALRSNPVVCIDKAQRQLGYRVRPLEDTLRDIHAWFRPRVGKPADHSQGTGLSYNASQ